METSVNNKCRAFTSIEQSKKLAEILPHESADMRIGNYVGKSGKVDGTNIHYYPKGESFGAPEIIDAWSLAALLDVLPKNLKIGRPSLESNYKGCYWIQYYDEFMKPNNYKTECFNNPVDACVAIIEKLHELKML